MFEGHSLTGRRFLKVNQKKKLIEKKTRKRKNKKTNPTIKKSRIDLSFEQWHVNSQDSHTMYVNSQHTGVEEEKNTKPSLEVHSQKVRDNTAPHVQHVKSQSSPISNMTISLPKELKDELTNFPEIVWSEIAREAFRKKLLELKGKALFDEENKNDTGDYLYT